ncbi:hypothetical protein Bpfe_021296 [Biomphalaria pfeifferi]|uniref:Uncharacterized protein n=1 Tax=Biomphalaria pfeifferi TaxID=112525 RepID=A0AAD8F3E8_BIOPF|nr:hypothetical protein Bpfe_021296 [Biomphalaria pfeifferi]
MRSMKKLATPSFINVHQLILQHQEVPEVMAVHSIEWMLQGILTSLLSGVGFYIITRALEYAKKYCQKERQKQNVFQKYFTEDENFHWRNFRVQGSSLVDDRFYNRAPNLFAAYKRSPGFLCHNNVTGNESSSATSVNTNGRPPQWSDLDLTDFRNITPFSSMLKLAEQTSHGREINEGTEVGLKKDSFCSSPPNVKIWSISDSYNKVDSSRESSSSNSAPRCELGASYCHGVGSQKKDEPHSTVTKKFDEKATASGRRARKASKIAHLPITKRNQVASKISECEVRVIKSKVMRSVYDVDGSETDPSLSSGTERIYNAFDSVIQEVKQTSSVTISSAAGTTKQHFVEHCQDQNAVSLVSDKSQRELNYFQSWAFWFATPKESQLSLDLSKSALEMSQFSEVSGKRQFSSLEDWQSSVDGIERDLEIEEQRKEETDSVKSVRPDTSTDTRRVTEKISTISEQCTAVKTFERTPVKNSNQTQDFDYKIVQEKISPALTCSFRSGSTSVPNSAHVHTSGSPKGRNAEKQTASSTSLKKPEKNEHSPTSIKIKTSPSRTHETKAISKAKSIDSASPLHRKPPKLQDRGKDETTPETLTAWSRRKRADKTRKLDKSVSCSPTTSEKSTMCKPSYIVQTSGKEPDTKDQLTEICSLTLVNDTSKCFGSTDIYQLGSLSNEGDMIDVDIPNQDVDRTKSLSSKLIYVLSKTNQRVPSFKTQKHKNLSKLKRAASKKNLNKQITKVDMSLVITGKASKEMASKREAKAGSTKTTEIVNKSGDQEEGQTKKTALKMEGSSSFKKQKNLKIRNSLKHKQIDSLEEHLFEKSEKEDLIPFQSNVKQCKETVLQKCNRRMKVHPLKSVDKYRTKRQSFLNKDKLSDNAKPLAHTPTEVLRLKDKCVESPVDEIQPLFTNQTKSHGVDSRVVESTSTKRELSLKLCEPKYLDFNGQTLAETAQFFLNTSESSVDPETKLDERSSQVHLCQTNGAMDSSVYSPSNPLDLMLSARLSPESEHAASSKLSAPPSTTHACKSVDKKILDPKISKTSSSAEKINKKDMPSSINKKDMPSSINKKDMPSSINKKDMPSSINKKDMPSSINKKDMPSSINKKDMPSSINKKDMPSSINKKDMPSSKSILKNKNMLSKETQQIKSTTEKSNVSKQAKEWPMATSTCKKRIQEPCLLKSKYRLEPAENMLLQNEKHIALKPIETKCTVAETNAQTAGQETPKSFFTRPSKNKPQVRREAKSTDRPSPKTTIPLKQNEKADIKRKAAVLKKSTAESPQVTFKERSIAKKEKPLGIKKKPVPLLPLEMAQSFPEAQFKHETLISTERNASSNGVAKRSVPSESQSCSSKVPPRPVKATVHSDESVMTIRSYDRDSDHENRSLRSRPLNADKQRKVVLKKSALDEIVKQMQSP